jgi:hypothetical protein
MTQAVPIIFSDVYFPFRQFSLNANFTVVIVHVKLVEKLHWDIFLCFVEVMRAHSRLSSTQCHVETREQFPS